MGDYPDAEDEFELMYGDELENLRDLEDDVEVTKDPESVVRRSLDFSSPAVRKTFQKTAHESSSKKIFNDDLDTITSERELFITNSESNVSLETHPISVAEEIHKNTPKRTVEDLFGDVDDIDFTEFGINAKKQKVDGDDAELLLIEKILEGRRMRSELLSAGRTVRDPKLTVKIDNLSYEIPRWPFVPLRRSDGRKVYVRMHSEEFLDNEIEEMSQANKGFDNIMGGSFQQVLEDAKKIIDEKWNKQDVQTLPDTESTDRTESEPLDTSVNAESENLSETISTISNSQLWVDRYKPKRYLELLSDESTNRTVLHWLKMWDKMVFNREFKQSIPEKQNRFNKSTGKFDFGANRRRYVGKGTQNVDTSFELDKNGAPVQKMALLCGPPGCGKTTLAHLIAKHAGYNIVEVNASDDRNVEAFRTALENATTMSSIVDSEKRPNCLVLDEIDGAPLPTIEFLIKYCSGAPINKTKKGQKAKPHILRRPIICICNDVYTPALRPLRQVAFVVHFPPTQSSRLAQRLLEVAELQHLSADVLTLTALSEKTSNDIRSCLGVLHFYKANNKPIRLADILKSNIGEKDLSKGLFQVWQEIFQVQLPKHQKKGSTKKMDEALAGLHEVMEYGPKQRFWRVLNTVNSSGDYEKLSQGIYENFLDQTRDTRMYSAVDALEWFVMNDIINTTIASLQNYVLYPYIPMAFVKWHFLFARFAWPKIKFPMQSFEVYQRQTLFSAILSSVSAGTCPKIKPYLSRKALTMDIIPLLPTILTPTLRPVNVQLYSEKEKDDLNSLIGIMIDYNISYIQERNAEGAYNYIMEPDIVKYAQFSESKPLKNLSYATKQMISREIDLGKLQRLEVAMTGANLGRETSRSNGTAAERVEKQLTKRSIQVDADDALPNHMQRLEPKKLKDPNAVLTTKDFFGRTVVHSPATMAKKAASKKADIVSGSSVFYHYQEGFNNAVRRDVKMHDLL